MNVAWRTGAERLWRRKEGEVAEEEEDVGRRGVVRRVVVVVESFAMLAVCVVVFYLSDWFFVC